MDNRRIERTPLDRTESRGPEGLGGPAKDRAVDPLEFARQIAAALHERKGTVGKAVLGELVAEFVKPILAALAQVTTVTTEGDVAAAVYRAATDTSGQLRFPAGPDAVALAQSAPGTSASLPAATRSA